MFPFPNNIPLCIYVSELWWSEQRSSSEEPGPLCVSFHWPPSFASSLRVEAAPRELLLNLRVLAEESMEVKCFLSLALHVVTSPWNRPCKAGTAISAAMLRLWRTGLFVVLFFWMLWCKCCFSFSCPEAKAKLMIRRRNVKAKQMQSASYSGVTAERWCGSF